jgi:Zn-dependent protease with chaperone function
MNLRRRAADQYRTCVTTAGRTMLRYRPLAANAFAIPGGHVYVFEGLIETANTPDELAGVIAHETGHVAHCDGVRALLQSAGLSFGLGMLLGGGGAAVIGVRTVLQSSYSHPAGRKP